MVEEPTTSRERPPVSEARREVEEIVRIHGYLAYLRAALNGSARTSSESFGWAGPAAIGRSTAP